MHRREDDLRGWLDPFASVGDFRVGVDGAKHARGGRFDALGALDDVFEREAEVAAAAIKKREGVGVSKNGSAGREMKFELDRERAAPLEEGFFDGVAFGMAADAAAAFVMRNVDGAAGLLDDGGGFLVHGRCTSRPR